MDEVDSMGSEGPPQASSIKAIDRGSVHRICSGQVVLTLATAVKELVENSIDAGATVVEVKLKEHGSELIEVSDNGSGVEEKDFEGMTLKHHTSKIQDFSDVVNVETFGFRGEALSSLCALSNLTVITRHRTADVGTKLEVDHNGKITQKIPFARQQGTTVTLQSLFHTLPVRHKEFQRNIKKEFAKLIQVLNSYCIISTNVRITCTNQVGKGNRSVVVSSNGNPSMRENIANVFGSKQISSLMEFVKSQPSEDTSSEFNVKVTEETLRQFSIEGFVSKCEHGQGRSSTDRQFFFINKRPWDSSKLSKVANEVYHQFNRHQYPFVALHVSMAKDLVDANVTPDKRQIFMQDEKVLLAVIKASLMKMYEPTTSIVHLNRVPSSGLGTPTGSPFLRNSVDSISRVVSDGDSITSQSSLSSCLGKLKRSFSSAFAREDSVTSPSSKLNISQQPKQRRLDTFVSRSVLDSEHDSHSNETTDFKHYHGAKAPDCQHHHVEEDVVFVKDENLAKREDPGISGDFTAGKTNFTIHLHSGTTAYKDEELKPDVTRVTDSDLDNHSDKESGISSSGSQETVILDSQESLNGFSHSVESVLQQGSSTSETKDSALSCDSSVEKDRTEFSPEKYVYGLHVKTTQYDKKEDLQKKEKAVKFSFTSLRQNLKKREDAKDKMKDFCRSFRATISPTENQAAEEELQREIKKDMFAKMKILGQFNLGFIIVKLGEDLFIVDQHATDEKYNFEMLQRHTVIQTQKLIQPQNLELTASNEVILMDNLEIFRKNGFEFQIVEEGQPTQRVKLTSIPVSKNWTFGKDDIEELIFMLTDSPGVMCRPSRVRQMFASRACRKSIMIGTALKKSEMKKLVCHMGEIEQPWNCPHGRPTMRHLINLNMIPR